MIASPPPAAPASTATRISAPLAARLDGELCCEHECDLSLLMGYCAPRLPPRTTATAVSQHLRSVSGLTDHGSHTAESLYLALPLSENAEWKKARDGAGSEEM